MYIYQVSYGGSCIVLNLSVVCIGFGRSYTLSMHTPHITFPPDRRVPIVRLHSRVLWGDGRGTSGHHLSPGHRQVWHGLHVRILHEEGGPSLWILPSHHITNLKYSRNSCCILSIYHTTQIYIAAEKVAVFMDYCPHIIKHWHGKLSLTQTFFTIIICLW